MRILLMGLCLSLLAGCLYTPEYNYSPAEEQRLVGAVLGDVLVEDDSTRLLGLNDEIESYLDGHIRDSWSDSHKLEELRALLFGEEHLNIQYDAATTRTAIETFEARQGNCLSMTSLFIAAARHVGLEADFEIVVVRPTWDHEGGTMIRYEHIVATGKLRHGESYVVDFLPEFVIGDQRSHYVNDETALSLYYNNLGAEALIDGELDKAAENLRKALALRPGDSDAWSNMGAVMKRSGDAELAEFSYRRALLEDATNYSALNNLAELYRWMGEEQKAREFMERVNRYRRRNPYFYFYVAGLFFREGQFEETAMLLERSIDLKRDEPEFYDALARTYSRMGDEIKSERYLALAEKYRERDFGRREMRTGSRLWTYTIDVN
ncbi:MAG: hypothetical protein HUJ31_10970 [Pseudomonadales bacterium]|nr:hypothetical protein [Pseudomonadales bacterium]